MLQVFDVERTSLRLVFPPNANALQTGKGPVSAGNQSVTRPLLIRAFVAFFMGLVLVVTMPGLTPDAHAQERRERKSILQLFFGGGSQARPEPKAEAPVVRSSRPKKKTVSRAPAPPPVPEVEKLENARKILVVGDFMAGGLAEGLTAAFSESPGVVVVDRSNGSSGLVRDDFYNWPQELPALLAEHQPAVVVMLIGSNDRQQLVIDGNREDVRSSAWTSEYERRTRAVIETVATSRVPLVWVGLPAFQSSSMTTDIVAFNGAYRTMAARANAEFVDIWDGFVDEQGKFVFTGSDINGQQVRLRGSDGINLTRAGKRKIAFYAEKPIRRLLGDAANTAVTGISLGDLPEITMPSAPDVAPALLTRTPPIALTDPELDGGDALLAAMPEAAALVPSPRDQLVRSGEIPAPPEGRVDDFSWPRAGR